MEKRRPRRRTTKVSWDARSVRALRRHLDLTQQELSEQLGVRQQTISEWETGLYKPRGPSVTLLSLISEHAGFSYGSGDE